MKLKQRGFGEIDGAVCLEHIADICLSERVEVFLTEHTCTICGKDRTPEEGAPFAVPLSELLDSVLETVGHFYADAVAVLPWDSEDGAFVGPQLDTWEAIDDIVGGAFEEPHSSKIIEMIGTAIDDGTSWTPWLADADINDLDYGWEQFSQIAMHQSRMVIGLGSPTDPPAKLANFLNSVLLYASSELGLVKQVSAGSAFYRGRLCEDAGSVKPHSSDLGPAPSNRAAANRMSPAGVALFYASGDPQTAIAEIAGHGVEPLAVVGMFKNMRELRILDLTGSPNLISPFCLERREHARMGRFLASFVSYITAPVIPDGRQHVAYAPTQLITDYLRWVPDPKLDGIALPSAQTGDCTYVLFLDRSDYGTLCDSVADTHAGLLPVKEHTLVLEPESVLTFRVVRQYSGVEAVSHHRARQA